jgi:hypothetical protein
MEKVAVKKVELVKIGYLPYAILENYEKLRNAFRFWRTAKTPQDRESARANAVYVAGILGHYVGDASMPMHMTIHYNGWADSAPNPKNYTKDRGLHSRYEAAYVNVAIDVAAVRPRVQPPQRLGKVWDSIKQHLTQGFADLDMLTSNANLHHVSLRTSWFASRSSPACPKKARTIGRAFWPVNRASARGCSTVQLAQTAPLD